MNKSTKLLLLAALTMAAVLMLVLGSDLIRDQRKLRELNSLLSESRAAWEETAEKKETLQVELRTAEEALKEANLTLKESDERAEKVQEEIETLEKEITVLKIADEIL